VPDKKIEELLIENEKMSAELAHHAEKSAE
jgi:hypothetical protein